MSQRAVYLSTLLVALAQTAAGQLVTIKTVPVAQGDQFDIFPSHTFGMAGVSIAVADSLLDPFVNPAKGSRVGAARFFSAPTVYGMSRGAGGGRTLPFAAIASTGGWYGGISLVLQEVDASRPPGQGGPFTPALDVARLDTAAASVATVPPRRDSYGNQYAWAMAGRALPGAGLSFGGSILWSRLRGIDGVDLLYAGSAGLKQSGHAVDVRVGLLKEWLGDRSLEAVVLHNRFDMTHDVGYLDLFWDPATQRSLQRPRLEHNRDQTNTWGLHLEYERPVATAGWRIGWLATVNRMSHPKLPEYELANVPVIPRDPGYSSAYNVGVGLSKARGPATFGIDVIYEPIWSYTWADAASPIATATGDTIPAGGKTVENHFRFSNALFRMGFSRELELRGLGRAVGLQLGLVLHSIHYWLAQYDNVQAAGRKLEEGWLEWTPTWGLSLRFPDLEIRYRGRATHGTGRPGVEPSGCSACVAAPDAFAGGNILVAPTGPLALQKVTTTTHQISLSLPIR